MAESLLRRTGVSEFTGMIVSSFNAHNWKIPTLLMRFVERNGIHTVFNVTHDAIEQFASLEVRRIYDITIKGSNVRLGKSINDFGIDNRLEVHLKYKVKIQVAKEGWPMVLPGSLETWANINQLPEGAFLNLIGRVTEQPLEHHSSPLQKVTLELRNEDLDISLELLGAKSAEKIVKGDVVAFASLRMKEYRQRRSMETTYLTVIEVNPSVGGALLTIPEISLDGPKKKAMRMTTNILGTVEQIRNAKQRFSAMNDSTATMDMTLVGELNQLTEAFFDDDVPITGDGHEQKMRWVTTFVDATGSFPVTVWDASCFDLFKVTASRLRELWEEGVEEPNKQQRILQILNTHLTSPLRLAVTVKPWERFGKDNTIEVNVHVNSVEAV